ncbi:MAG: penicillin acylase family protein [candidate division Zixibacteria bacterium]|nr:penicillin acylase family protein [candidate division Zixibacteria bacterium]
MKKFGWIAGIIVAVIISFIAGTYYYLTQTLPDYNSDISSATITDSIEIIRDSYGMPHIYAKSDSDMSFAFGFCSAQDRLFQMDMVRRAIRGQLAEVIGKDVVEVDKMYRTITSVKPIEQIYSELPDSLQALMVAYANGVNHYLETHEENLPIEFAILGYEPEPWQPSDCMATLYYMAWALNFSFDSELTYAAMIDRVGDAMASEIFIDYPTGKPVILPEEYSLSNLSHTIETIRLARLITGTPIRGGSNNWVVSGKKSSTGKPLLANDMHLGMIAPAIWYEVHLITSSVNVSGVALAGTPLIIAGANENVAWGFTNVMADDADYYLEKINPEDSGLYEFKGSWEEVTTRYDTIAVLNDSAIIYPIRSTRHGVIIDDIVDSTIRGNPVYSIAMRWTIADFGQDAQAIYQLNRARSVSEIEKAVELYKCPGQNWVYADIQGNIGFWAAVGIPRRDGFDGQGLLPGWDGQHEWGEYIPTDEQPHITNPEQGWIASANNKTASDDYPYYISHCYAPSERIERISQLLTEKEKLGIDDFKRIQADDYLIVAERWCPILIQALENSQPSVETKQIMDELSDWDYMAGSESVPAAVFHTVWQYLIEYTFQPHLGDTLYKYFITENSFTVHKAMQNLIDKPESPWFDDPDTDAIENLDSVLVKSFDQALSYLHESLGDNSSDWQWGKLHSVTIFHPIGRILPIIGNYLNIGPFPVGGGSHSVNPSIYRLSNPWAMVAGASQRHIFDLNNIDNSLRIIPTGVSGNFMSPHYRDQSERWLKVEYRPFVLSRKEVEKDVSYRMSILPVNKAEIDLKP